MAFNALKHFQSITSPSRLLFGKVNVSSFLRRLSHRDIRNNVAPAFDNRRMSSAAVSQYDSNWPINMLTEMMERQTSMLSNAEMLMRNWMRGILPQEVRDVTFRPMSMVEYNSFSNPITQHDDGSRSLNLCFDVKGFKPEEIKVEVQKKERALVVDAKHEVKEKEHYVYRHFTRRFTIPDDLHVDISKIELKSSLTPEGLLVIEAPLPRLTAEELKALNEKHSAKSSLAPSVPTVEIPITIN